MRIFLIILTVIIMAGCAGKEAVKEPVKNDNEKTVKIEKTVTEEAPSLGWSDTDTYTVSVSAPDLTKAKEAARHKILQDIVKVRMMNESRYTDITKISSEFDKPLKEGKVLSQKQAGSEVQIYFQIKDKGLKEKFERK